MIINFIIIPGGMYVSEVIEKDTKIKSLISVSIMVESVFADLCSTDVFRELGILKNKEYTIFLFAKKIVLKVF